MGARIIPALAGNTSCIILPKSSLLGSSPLSRGIPSGSWFRGGWAGIIPALAGNTRSVCGASPRRSDHPRSRGEYLLLVRDNHGLEGSSPLSRGIRGPGCCRHRRRRIIPALAGNTGAASRDQAKAWDHPRSRGEYMSALRTTREVTGSSPLSRGILLGVMGAMLTGRIIPALAGNTLSLSGGIRLRGDHPRSRGEYVTLPCAGLWHGGSSPLSRGIHEGGNGQNVIPRIIPALAGNTRQ